MFPKDGRLESAVYLEFVRGLDCIHCNHPRRSEAHHYPPKGRRAAWSDLRVMPLCLRCHQRAHGQAVVDAGRRLEPISKYDQDSYTALTLQRFIDTAPWPMVEQVLRELKRWREGRGESVAY